MAQSSGHVSSRRLNVLTLDGGGVRGLSSLLILKELMAQINARVRDQSGQGESHKEIQPDDIFDLVAGTSTGGLIAIMLGKLGMSLDECIEAYHNLARTIFSKKHIRGRLTGGLAPSKFSGSNLRKHIAQLVVDKRGDKDLPMAAHSHPDRIACAVVCREHNNESRYSRLKQKAVCLCSSKPCPELLECLVCDAARATSAAPTFFPAQPIKKRLFVDGGMEFNNPSHVIFHHYSEPNWCANSKRASIDSRITVPAAVHGNLDFTRVRFVNLGTGTEPDIPQPYQKSFIASLEPAFIRMGRSLKRMLKESATNPENVADQMISLARVSRGGSVDFKYIRFSADNGVSYVEMDKFRHLGKIEELTCKYLSAPEIQSKLGRLAGEIADEYLARQRVPYVQHNGLLDIPRAGISTITMTRPQTPTSRPSPHVVHDASSQSSGTAQSGSNNNSNPPSSGDNSNSSATSVSTRRFEDVGTPEGTPTKSAIIPPIPVMDIVGPADASVINSFGAGTETLAVRA